MSPSFPSWASPSLRSSVGSLRCALVGVGVFLLCIVGILSRPHFDLATFWPANAFMLGMLVRFPSLQRTATWIWGAVGFFAADALTGSDLGTNLVLNGGNLATISTGYFLLKGLPEEDRALRRPASILYLLRMIVGVSLLSGLIGLVANPFLFGSGALEGFAFWSATELANYAAFLPVLLTWPTPRLPHWFDLSRLLNADWSKGMPLGALVASCLAGAIIGGPGAVAFPVPALLWCALTYNLFSTACLSFVFGAWTLTAMRIGLLPVEGDINSRPELISMRIGVTLVALAPLVVASVMSARDKLLKDMKMLVDFDMMTGLRNRRAFYETGTRLLAGSVENALSAAVMMLDIDHFKSVNDRYGHDAGDQVLRAFAEVLKNNLRPQDTVGRIGGEEFAVVLPDCRLEQATLIAGRINSVLNATEITLENGETLSVTVSIGIHLETTERTLQAPLAQADKALYRAKRTGRNRYELSLDAG